MAKKKSATTTEKPIAPRVQHDGSKRKLRLSAGNATRYLCTLPEDLDARFQLYLKRLNRHGLNIRPTQALRQLIGLGLDRIDEDREPPEPPK